MFLFSAILSLAAPAVNPSIICIPAADPLGRHHLHLPSIAHPVDPSHGRMLE
jgi:hypothetical protein